MGLEIITQPQLFLRPLTALNGVEGVVPPYFATFHTCVTSSPVSSYTFPLTGQVGLHITNSSDSYIVNIDGVVQPPPSYSVDANTRIITFVKPIPPNTEIFITQIGTTVSMVSVASLTADKSYLRDAVAENLFVTALTALSAEIRIVDITQYELSGYTIRGNTDVIGNLSVSQLITATNLYVEEATNSKNFYATNNIFTTNLTANTLSANRAFIVSLSTNSLSATTAFISNLSAKIYANEAFIVSLTADSLSASTAFISNLTADSLSANTAFISNLTANNVLVTSSLTALTGTTSYFNVTQNAVLNNLSATQAFITNLNANSLTATSGEFNALTVKGQITATNIPFTYYLPFSVSQTNNRSLSAVFSSSGSFNANDIVTLLPNNIYQIDYFLYQTDSVNTMLCFALSADKSLAGSTIYSNYITISGGSNFGVPVQGGQLDSGAPPIAWVRNLTPFSTSSTNTNRYSEVKVTIKTDETLSLVLAISGNRSGDTTTSSFSRRTVTQLN